MRERGKHAFTVPHATDEHGLTDRTPQLERMFAAASLTKIKQEKTGRGVSLLFDLGRMCVVTAAATRNGEPGFEVRLQTSMKHTEKVARWPPRQRAGDAPVLPAGGYRGGSSDGQPWRDCVALPNLVSRGVSTSAGHGYRSGDTCPAHVRHADARFDGDLGSVGHNRLARGPVSTAPGRPDRRLAAITHACESTRMDRGRARRGSAAGTGAMATRQARRGEVQPPLGHVDRKVR